MKRAMLRFVLVLSCFMASATALYVQKAEAAAGQPVCTSTACDNANCCTCTWFYSDGKCSSFMGCKCTPV